MNKNKYFAILSTLLLSACADSNGWMESVSTGEPLQVLAQVEQQYITRANDGGFATSDEIGVYIVNREDGQSQPLQVVGNHADNVRFTYDASNGTWTGSHQLYWKDKKTHVDAYGYYPFDADLRSVEDYPFCIQRNQRDNLTTGRKLSGYEASDFLWAKAEDITPGTPINLKHHHLMAGIQVKLIEGEYFNDGEWDSLEKSVLVENTALDTYINLGTGVLGISRKSIIASIIPQQRGTQWRAVIAPQTIEKEKTLLSITVDGVSYNFQRTSAMIYYPGKLHKFTIKVDKRLPEGDYQFSLLNEVITPWENDAESHNGEAREYVTVHVNEHQFLGDAIDSLGLDPSKIVNLKITGYLGKIWEGYFWLDNSPMWSDGSKHFTYIRENMPNLEAINLKEVTKFNGPAGGENLSWTQIMSNAYDGSWNPYEQNVDNFDGCLPRDAFGGMTSLKYFVWPDYLEALGDGAFSNTSLTGSLILPEGLKYLGGGSFTGEHKCNLTGELYIPSSVEYIGGGVFSEWFGDPYRTFFTSELILPEKLKYLGSGAFGGCAYMTGTIHVPDGITELNNAWPNQIKGPVVIPQGVKKINGFPIGGMGDVVIPEGVTEIEREAFQGRPYIRNVHLPSTLKKIGVRCFDYSSITHINLPEGLEIIEDVAFNGCMNLQDTIVIPSTVIQIRERAFAGCSQLTAVILPAGLQGIQSGAFGGCYSLDYIECLGAEPPAIEENTFSGVEKDNFTVVVPEGAVEAYKNAPHWCEFKRISSDKKFVCRPMQAKLLNKSNVRDVVLNADTDWSIQTCPSWMHVLPTSGTKKTELKVTIDDMPHNQGDREGTIVFQLARNDENGNPITCTYTVKQFDYEIEEDAVLTLQTATQGQRGGIDILFVGDGYDAEDIAKGTYRTDMEQEMEYFFGVEPYKTYRQYFNVSAAMAMSYESGVLDSPDKWRNTKFNVTWGAGNNGRLSVPFEDIAYYVLNDIEQSPVTASNVSRSLIICVPNSDAYEGLTAMYADGSAIAVCPMSKLDYPNDARGLVQHEAGGHGWGKLDDEYVYHRDNIHTCHCWCCSHAEAVESMHAMGWGRNVSLSSKYKDVEWSHLIFHPQYDDIVDIYEGGHMHAQGIFRSEVNSCMNNNVPYFSTWSRQLIVERIKEAAGETFSFDDFVNHDSRAYGSKFLTRGMNNNLLQQVKAIYSEGHGPVIKPGSPVDCLKKKGGRK